MGSTAALTFATFAALSGIVLVAVGFGNSSWREYTVDDTKALWETKYNKSIVGTSDFFYNRTVGFFKRCFPNDYPSDNQKVTWTKSPLGNECTDVKYNEEIKGSQQDDDEQLYIHLKRLYLALYVVGLFLCFLSILTLLSGCSRSSHPLVFTTAVLLLFASGFIAAGIGCWHKFIALDEYALKTDPHVQSWPEAVIKATVFTYGWSYIVAWIGVGLLLIGSIIMFVAGCFLRSEEGDLYDVDKEMVDNRALVAVHPSMYPYDKSIYASPQAMTMGYPYGGGNPYAQAGYANYGYSGYNPYSYYYAQHYYPNYASSMR